MKVKYIKLPNREYASNKGLAEKIARKHLISNGYEVWRGSFFNFLGSGFNAFKYHEEKYQRLIDLLKKEIGMQKYVRLMFFAKINAGMPDFVAAKGDELFFVEVKLEEEQLKENQRVMISFLNNCGLITMLFRISKRSSMFRKELDLKTGRSKVTSHIPKLNSRSFKP